MALRTCTHRSRSWYHWRTGTNQSVSNRLDSRQFAHQSHQHMTPPTYSKAPESRKTKRTRCLPVRRSCNHELQLPQRNGHATAFLEAIASRLEAIAIIRLEAIAGRLRPSLVGWRPSLTVLFSILYLFLLISPGGPESLRLECPGDSI